MSAQRPPAFPGDKPRIVIIGSGPTGLGAACRLQQLGHSNWVMLESSKDLGGLATTIQDDNGFLWDMGGHVIFSHYRYFDTLLDAAVTEWVTHQRSRGSGCEMSGYVPIPEQHPSSART